jgi:hypothetical protein
MTATQLLCQSQLAERWSVSERKLEADRYKGTGCPFIKIGSCVRYRLNEVIAYENTQLRTSTSDVRGGR